MNFDTISSVLGGLNIFSVTFRFILAVILGGAVGINREEQNRPAGLRTHVLVCLGTAIAMVTGEYIFYQFGSIGDPSRIGAQVVSGIGFLGAGTIIISGRHVKGLTTAAGLWATACMGLAVGIGFYSAAVIGGILIVLTLTIMKYLSFRMRRKSNQMLVYVQLDDDPKSYVNFLKFLKSIQVKMLDTDWSEKAASHMETGTMVSVRLPKDLSHEKFISELESLPFVLYTIEQD